MQLTSPKTLMLIVEGNWSKINCEISMEKAKDSRLGCFCYGAANEAHEAVVKHLPDEGAISGVWGHLGLISSIFLVPQYAEASYLPYQIQADCEAEDIRMFNITNL